MHRCRCAVKWLLLIKTVKSRVRDPTPPAPRPLAHPPAHLLSGVWSSESSLLPQRGWNQTHINIAERWSAAPERGTCSLKGSINEWNQKKEINLHKALISTSTSAHIHSFLWNLKQIVKTLQSWCAAIPLDAVTRALAVPEHAHGGTQRLCSLWNLLINQ